jgi:hypothetical protein
VVGTATRNAGGFGSTVVDELTRLTVEMGSLMTGFGATTVGAERLATTVASGSARRP